MPDYRPIIEYAAGGGVERWWPEAAWIAHRSADVSRIMRQKRPRRDCRSCAGREVREFMLGSAGGKCTKRRERVQVKRDFIVVGSDIENGEPAQKRM